MRTSNQVKWRCATMVLIFLTGMVPDQVPGQHCVPASSGVSTTPWQTFSVDTTAEALPLNQINAVWVEDGETVWVGTGAGLSRYDGDAWRLYTAGDGLGNENVQALHGDEAGGIWVGTINGLSHFDGVDFYPVDHGLNDNWIRSLATDGNGGVWIGTLRGADHFDGRRFDQHLQALDDRPLGAVRAILPLGLHGTYFAVDNQVIYLPHQGSGQRYGVTAGLDGGRVQALAKTEDDRIWAGTAGGLYRFADDAFEHILLSTEAGGAEPDVLALSNDDAGGLWLGTSQGLWHFNGDCIDNRLTKENSGLTTDRIQTIHRTEDGTLWLGTYNGLVRWNPTAWQVYPAAGLNIWAGAAADNRLWVTSEAGVAVWDGQRWRQVTDTAAFGLWPDGDVVWFGTAAGLQRVALNEMRVSAEPFLSGVQPRVISGDMAGNLWVGTDDGLFHFRQGALVKAYDELDGLRSDFVNALLVEENAVWVGTSDGLSLFQNKLWHTISWEANILANRIRSIVRGADGSLWVGTDDGLRRLPVAKTAVDLQNWQRYASEDGLADNAVNAIWADPNGQIWVGTDGGLNGLDDNGTLDKWDDVWVSLTTGDGLPANRVTAVWRDAAGALWIGTAAELIHHTPIARSPAVKVTGVQSEGRVLPFANIAEPLALDWGQTDVEILFSGASLSTKQLTYRYRLGDQAWQVTTRPLAELQLEPGHEYEFTVQTFDLNLNTSPPISRVLSVAAIPLLSRPWVQRSGVVAVVLLAAGVLVLGPGGRWWRAYRRATYRETWDVHFSQSNPHSSAITIMTQQHVHRDLRLFVEGRGSDFFVPHGQPLIISRDLSSSASLLLANPPSIAALDDPNLRASLATQLAGLLPPPLTARWQETAVQETAVQGTAAKQGYFVRLRLDFSQAPALAAWPWELVPVNEKPLSRNPATAVSRRFAGAVEDMPPDEENNAVSFSPVPLISRHKPLNLLLVVASPVFPPAYDMQDLPELIADDELKRLTAALKGRKTTINLLAGVGAGGPETKLDMPDALANALKDMENGPPDIIHFSSHAGPHPRHPKEIVLYLEDNQGQFKPLGGPELEQMIGDSQQRGGGPKLLVLNGCQTAMICGDEASTGLVHPLVTQTGLLAIVGMQYRIRQEAADIFTSVFYSHLAATQPVDYAISVAREAMAQGQERIDWAAPVLYMRPQNGMIFEP